ncbi:MAG: tRNA lysidine(34) synthetase TilS [Bacteroidota bacterium]
MDLLKEQFRQFVKSENLFSAEMPLLLACSGGQDSVALAHLLYQCGYKFGIAHCNFNLRAEASIGDEEFCRSLAAKLGAAFHCINFTAADFAAFPGESVQMAARKLRYNWFKELMRKQGYKRLLTAHHANDQAETILMHLIQGAGPKTMRAMLPKRGALVRPLLFAEKELIKEYIEDNEITWREDSSNASDYYRRNYIRHNIMPLLQNLNPKAHLALAATATKMQQAWPVLGSALAKFRKQGFVSKEGDRTVIQTAGLDNNRVPEFILSELLKPFGFIQADIANILQAKQVGKVFSNKHFTLYVSRGELVINPTTSEADKAEVQINNSESGSAKIGNRQFKWRKVPSENYTLLPRPALFACDAAKLKFPLVLRPWQPGDWFCPFGMNGTRKKLSAYLTDAKVPVDKKQSALVLCSGRDIIWVTGMRSDDRYRLNNPAEASEIWEMEITG